MKHFIWKLLTRLQDIGIPLDKLRYSDYFKDVWSIEITPNIYMEKECKHKNIKWTDYVKKV